MQKMWDSYDVRCGNGNQQKLLLLGMLRRKDRCWLSNNGRWSRTKILDDQRITLHIGIYGVKMFSTGWARFAHQFTNYYRNSKLWSPPRTRFREWMFIPFGNTPPIRHKAFSDVEGVRKFITQRPMHSCFYSTAYWHKPYEIKNGWKRLDWGRFNFW